MSEDEVMNKEDDGDLTNDPYQENEDSDDELEDDQEPDDYVVEEDDDTIDLTHLSKTEVRILLLKDLGKPTASTEKKWAQNKKNSHPITMPIFQKRIDESWCRGGYCNQRKYHPNRGVRISTI